MSTDRKPSNALDTDAESACATAVERINGLFKGVAREGMRPGRRRLGQWGVGIAAAGLGIGAGLRSAQAQPATSRIVVPFAAGTTTDAVGRVLARPIGQRLGQTMLIENRPGAGGSIATEQVARAAADGRTLVLGTVGTHAINASLFRKLPYDPVKDFRPVAFVGYTPLLLLVGGQSPAKQAADLVALSATDKGLTFASAGNGTSGHLAGELLAQQGKRMVHVPYKDGAQALTDLMAGNVDFMFYHPTAVLAHLQSGRLRAIGATSLEPVRLVPDAKPLASQGMPAFNLVAWFALYAPAGIATEPLESLRKATEDTLADAGIRSQLQDQGLELRDVRGDALERFTQSEVQRWAALVQRSGARVD